MQFQISEALRQYDITCKLAVIRYEINVRKSPTGLLQLLEQTIQELHDKYTLSDIAVLSNIHTTREAYKSLGKSPQEYRNAAEAMLRRVVKGSGLYHINNVVEVNNLISILSGYSIGSYDEEHICGAVTLKRAPDGETYRGIGKEEVNIEHLPTLYDEMGAFGNPTSDSQRTMIRMNRHKVVSVFYGFGPCLDLNDWVNRFKELLKEFCDSTPAESLLIQ